MSAARDLLEDRDLVRPFRLALLAVGIVFVLIGGLLAAYGTGADRPEGVAERWISDVGDLRRDGVKVQAQHRVEKVGPVALGAQLLPTGSTNGRTAFTDIEVGKASSKDGVALVPYRLHQRIDGSPGPAHYGTIQLTKLHGHWHVTALQKPWLTMLGPSEGGPPAAQAPFGLFLGAVFVAALVTAFCVALVKAADPGPLPGP